MSRHQAFFIAAVLQLGAVALVGACSDTPSKPEPAVPGTTGTSAGGGGGGGGEAGVIDGGLEGGEGGVCTDVVNTGTLVDRTGVNGDPPVSIGGTIVDGTFDLTAFSVFVGVAGTAGPTGITARSTIRITGSKIEQIIEIGGTGKTTTVSTTSGTFTATGATFAETDLCPAGAARQLQFTAMDPLLTLTDLTTKEAFTFTKR
ncbi:MAG: hypothetical protein JWO86_2589 [Myxococcaceae bacterium]|nr:hypothetical protein [Myxococcaceae bacterium]MEA2746430.1 hypothetical protein [Myxococcales bacterium]